MTGLNIESLMKNIAEKNQAPQKAVLDIAMNTPPQTTQPTQNQQIPVSSEQALTNQFNTVEEKKEEISLGNIKIGEHEEEEQKKQIALGDSGNQKKAETEKEDPTKYKKQISLAGNILAIAGFIILGCFGYKQYISIGLLVERDPTIEEYFTKYQDLQKTVSQYTKIDDYYEASQKYTDITKSTTVDEILGSNRISFVQKKDILGKALINLHQNVKENYAQRNTVKEEVAKYKFLPEQLFGALNAKENTLSMKSLILSTETIKFGSAIKVFSHLQTFIDGLANLLNITPKEVQEKMKQIDKTSNKDIPIYINDCYLNPFEVDYDCNTIGDFNKYYQFIDTKNETDKWFLKKLMSYIDVKLEQTNVPSFLISFSQFNPKQKEITFTLEVNTFKQDEITLANEGILNPHLFITTNLINLFRQSLIIVGDSIKTNSIKSYPKVIKVGNTVFNVNNSSLNFTLPIQKKADREISDFIFEKK